MMTRIKKFIREDKIWYKAQRRVWLFLWEDYFIMKNNTEQAISSTNKTHIIDFLSKKEYLQ